MTVIKKQDGGGNHAPNRLGIFSHAGEGKTAIMAGLDNALLIDFEDRSHHHTGDVFNLKQYMVDNDCSELKALGDLVKTLKEEAQKGNKYKYIIFDTMSSMEVVIRKRATMLFNNSLIGKGMAKKGNKITDAVTQLANGQGYVWLNSAYEEILGMFDGLASDCYIYNCHIKQGSKLKDAQELTADDINLTGKLKASLVQNCQAFGKFYRTKDNKGILSFKQDERNLVTKASSPHLFNKDIVISEMDDKGNLTYHWDKIFDPK